MRLVEPDIVTYCVGQAASMAAVLLACGTRGKRYSLPHSRILIHQPSMSGLAGQATDIDIYAKEILRMRETLNDILAKATNQSLDRIARDVDRDYILEPDAALEYGLIDRIIASRSSREPVPVTK
jgi:ATP-dependent Clp protease protease subunit